jgi:hypothetical protein
LQIANLGAGCRDTVLSEIRDTEISKRARLIFNKRLPAATRDEKPFSAEPMSEYNSDAIDKVHYRRLGGAEFK